MSEIVVFVQKVTAELTALSVAAEHATEALDETFHAQNAAGVAGSGTVTGGGGNTGGVGSSSSMEAVISEIRTISGRG